MKKFTYNKIRDVNYLSYNESRSIDKDYSTINLFLGMKRREEKFYSLFLFAKQLHLI